MDNNNEKLNDNDYIVIEEISEVLDKDGNTIKDFSNKNKKHNNNNNYKSFSFTINNNSLFGKILTCLIPIAIVLLIGFLTFYVVPIILAISLIIFLIRKIFKYK